MIRGGTLLKPIGARLGKWRNVILKTVYNWSRKGKMDISLEYYRIFYYIGKYGSITAAAQELSLSQPAVSQGLKLLEKTLGAPLFVRTPKGVRFTAEGEAMYSYVARGYETLRQGEKVLKQMLNLETGEIHIGASDMTLKYYLLPYLEQYHAAYPDIKIMVSNAPTPETLEYLRDGKIDFAVVSSPVRAEENLEVWKVRRIEDIFIAGGQFAHLKGRILTYAELMRLPTLFLEKNTSTRAYIDDFLREQSVSCSPEIELATSDMLVQFARKNLGVAGVVRDFAEEYIQSGEVFQLKFDRPIPERSFCIVMNRNVPKSSAASKLLEGMEKDKYK